MQNHKQHDLHEVSLTDFLTSQTSKPFNNLLLSSHTSFEFFLSFQTL